MRASRRKWKEKNKERYRLSERKRQSQPHNLERRRAYKKDPIVRQHLYARVAVYKAVRDGTLKRPKTCPTCKKRAKIHAHHIVGYARKNWLKVKWLCLRCHSRQHNQKR